MAAADGPRVLPCILVTHGELGRALVSVVESILGPQERVFVLTNDDRSSDGLRRLIEDELARLEDRPVFVFVDLLGGSCGHVCIDIQRAHAGVHVVTGVNLPMLLEFAHKRRRLPPDDLMREILRKGQEGIRCLPTTISS